MVMCIVMMSVDVVGWVVCVLLMFMSWFVMLFCLMV